MSRQGSRNIPNVILEAFSQTLHQEWHKDGKSAVEVLHGWLLSVLTEATPRDNITRVIHTEVALVDVSGCPTFVSRSPSGEMLLKSLYLYCESYEHWQFRRWLHQLKPHRFC